MPVGPGGLSRRGFLIAAGGVAAGLTGVAGDAFLIEARRVQLNRADVAVPMLPAELEGLTIAHLSDIHLYDGIHPAALHAMELVQAARPDVTLVTGDVIENLEALADAATFIAACRGRLATAVTIGNWEHAQGISPEQLDATCRSVGATFLFNSSQLVRTAGRPLALVGLDDPRAGAPDPSAALREVPAEAVAIWGFHAPGYADELMAQQFPKPALIFAGHTHGGQIRPPLLPAITPVGSGRFVEGWYRDSFAPLFVSRGVGTSDVRARFRCPPEVGVFRLVRG
jgi:hypothetical protein